MLGLFRKIKDYLVIKRSGLFDADYYLLNYPDVSRADVNPLWHFVSVGWKEGRNPSNFFNTFFYLETNKDIGEAGVNPLVHFIKFGASEFRNPNPIFDMTFYVKSNPDLIKNKVNPLLHYIRADNRDNIRISENRIYAVDPKLIPLGKYPIFSSMNDLYWKIEGLPNTDHVDIVICVGPNPKHIKNCLVSIEKCTDLKVCTIHLMVDKKHRENVFGFVLPNLVIHEYCMDRFNYSKVNNFVMRTSKNDVILLNDDTEVSDGWFEKLRIASKGVALTGAHTKQFCSGNPDMWNEGPIVTTKYPINMFCVYIPKRVREVVGL